LRSGDLALRVAGRRAGIRVTPSTPYQRPASRHARRYALFTLVGIAGEDDLDAPDLAAPIAQASATEKTTAFSQRPDFR